MALLILAAIGPRAEELALEAGDAADIAVGYDPGLDCATFDSETLDAEELQAAVFEVLATLDGDWRSHLVIAD